MKTLVLSLLFPFLLFNSESSAMALTKLSNNAYCKISDMKFSSIRFQSNGRQHTLLLNYRCGFKECSIPKVINNIFEDNSLFEISFNNNSTLKIFKNQLMYGYPVANLNLGNYKYFAFQCIIN